MADMTFEASYWGDCANSYFEEQKQWVYARLMGLQVQGYSIDLKGRSVLDVGGGPVSLLLKTTNGGRLKVVDPLQYPDWVYCRYAEHSVFSEILRGEDLHEEHTYDEVWIYNVLQHVEDPTELLKRAKASAKLLRIFEWIDIPAHEGHPHMLTQPFLDEALGRRGATLYLHEQGCVGRCYFNVVSQGWVSRDPGEVSR
jgi:hypothetical protein